MTGVKRSRYDDAVAIVMLTLALVIVVHAFRDYWASLIPLIPEKHVLPLELGFVLANGCVLGIGRAGLRLWSSRHKL
ncbi:hypothetical protein CGH72_17045 [Vibrio parahaemolyticus]|uniref:hypothetical protein n=1 Tax=Vibrio parahaemolyticus TaxID=670 RepID=UPI001121AD69|nr:hypothetical protein [Vibrio parahaemolyticus]TOM63516.1 hypothetical protein CGH75_02705 [Vibrio parahaemolyticus]TOM64383.1 hypothetical protein CGH73_22345 [Vibrio parahaemolyticus]TOM69273.1 hypothetical protein CGH72_17045 [Vibrio parahaemolyticus]TOM97741.1 hypothetical protein CGH67_25725 [Vibrio parahaemolyticus]TOO90050.1 hypothetical protein CGH29_03720 [Vibrio parahaemolyticus]